MNRKTGLILMIAVVCGLGAMFASSRILTPSAVVPTRQASMRKGAAQPGNRT